VSDVAKKPPTKQASTSTGRSAASAIDRDKLRAAVRRLGDEYVFYMLDDAIDLLPPAKLAKLVSGYLDVKQLRPDAPGKKNLLAEVRAFATASRAGKYYESFNVNSKNFMDKSTGTRAFIADCNRLLDRCVAQAPKGDAAEIREAIEIILGLLRYIDECNDDVIFFADEAGSWQVGVDWAKVLPALFSCLSRTTEPEDYARRVVEVVDEYDSHDRGKHWAAARRVATAAQRKALRAVSGSADKS
jgi:hypothetical protein